MTMWKTPFLKFDLGGDRYRLGNKLVLLLDWDPVSRLGCGRSKPLTGQERLLHPHH
jgi:hypothetical protein